MNYHLAKREYFEASKMKLLKQIELSEYFSRFVRTDYAKYIFIYAFDVVFAFVFV